MLSPIPRRGAWDHGFCSCSPKRVSLPRKRGRVGPRIVLFETCSAFPRVTACTLATSPYFVTRGSPEASTVSLPPQLLRLLPAGASPRVGLSPTGKRRLSTAHPIKRTLSDPSKVQLGTLNLSHEPKPISEIRRSLFPLQQADSRSWGRFPVCSTMLSIGGSQYSSCATRDEVASWETCIPNEPGVLREVCMSVGL